MDAHLNYCNLVLATLVSSTLLLPSTVEYTDIAKHAKKVAEANGVDHIVTIIQGEVETIELPIEEDQLESDDPVNHPNRVVDIMISEWMGYFLLRESMLDSLIRARDKYLKPLTGLTFQP